METFRADMDEFYDENIDEWDAFFEQYEIYDWLNQPLRLRCGCSGSLMCDKKGLMTHKLVSVWVVYPPLHQGTNVNRFSN